MSWDCRSEDGPPLPAGKYTVILEATLRGENGVLYRTVVNVGGAAQSASRPSRCTPAPEKPSAA